jgi:hypothetical protein
VFVDQPEYFLVRQTNDPVRAFLESFEADASNRLSAAPFTIEREGQEPNDESAGFFGGPRNDRRYAGPGTAAQPSGNEDNLGAFTACL